MAFNGLKSVLAVLAAVVLLAGCSQEDGDQPVDETATVPAEKSTPTPDDQAIVADPSRPPLPIEEVGSVETLPETYPEDWVMVDEANFFNMYNGKMIVLDVTEESQPKRIKGMIHKSLLANFTQSKKRPEFYVMESFHERGWRGKKTDVLTIYDKRSLEIIKEIDWTQTGTDRLQALPERYSMTVSGNDQFLFVANFNPASSITVVDLDSHEIVGTYDTAGCVLTYPTGARSVSSICSNGGMLTTVVGESGELVRQVRMEPFFDPIETPVFERPAIIDGIAYFPSFLGEMHAVDLRGEIATYQDTWSLVTDQERAANWRPAGLALTDKDDQGRFYVIFQPDGHEGSHGHGGPEVWVFDVESKEKIKRIEVPNWAVSIALTRGSDPKLVVTNGEMNLDIIDVGDGSLIQTVSDFSNVTPLLVHKSY